MTLHDLQRALARVCLDPSPSPDDLAALGGPEIRWWVYRELVRGRFEQCLAEVLPRTREALTERAFNDHIAAWLQTAPPRTRYYRELVGEFVEHLARDPEAVNARAPWAMDLCRYERAVVASLDAPSLPDDEAVGEFAMELPPRITPSARLLRLAWSVLDAVPTHAPTSLLLYRDEATRAVETLALTELVADMMAAMLAGGVSVTGCIQQALARHDASVHAGLIEALAEILGDYLDRGVILGSSVENV